MSSKGILALVLVALATASRPLVAAQIRTVALSGMPAPGHPRGIQFSSFDSPVINVHGEVAFRANNLPHVSNPNDGIWSEGGELGLRLIAYDGQAINHSTGVDAFLNFGRPFLNSNGVVAFDATAGAECRDCGIPMILIEDDSRQLNVVARRGWPAPMTTDLAPFSGLGLDDFNNQGEAVFEAQLTAAFDRDHGVWITTAGNNARLVARDGDQAPGLPPGVKIQSISNQTSQFELPLTDAGQSSFITNGFEAAWVGSSYGDLRRLFARGDAVPGLSDLATFLSVGQPRLTDDGDAIFHAGFKGAGIGSDEDIAVFRGNGDAGFRVVVREGGHAPGLSTGAAFQQFDFEAVNNVGDTVFEAYATDPASGGALIHGLWIDDLALGLQLVARSGVTLPGLSPSESFYLEGRPLLNDLGQTVFRGEIAGPSINASNDEAIWVRLRDGGIELVMREGQTIDVDDGQGADLRTITAIGFLDDRSFSSLGQLALQATFSDGEEGIFVFRLVAVPEPAARCLMMIALSRLMSRKRSRRQRH
jgi:hypothetical protein